ncbi:MAG: glycosyltransferase family 4 protein [Actinobacteria bacterium]|nr:glycosyltransferase family 4 protein [Actinomycetota bacterium]
MSLRICLVGDISGNIDEGMKKITYNIYKGLSENHEVMIIKPSEIPFKKKEIADFKPDIIHYIPGPSILSFALLKLAKLGLSYTKTVITATHPQHLVPKRVLSILKPDLVLAQAYDMEALFRKLNIRTELYPNGVDIKKFKPVDERTKMELREKYGIDKDKFVVLHVGNLRAGRNLDFLKILKQDDDMQVVVVASTTIRKDIKIYNNLIDSRIKIIDYYVEDIENIYNLSDVYVFPVTRRPYAVEVPLSVMEAMACNLPVISTRFAGLPTFFPEGDGLIYINTENDIIRSLYFIKDRILENNLKIRTRKKVLPYSWDKLLKKLELIYFKLIEAGGDGYRTT